MADDRKLKFRLIGESDTKGFDKFGKATDEAGRKLSKLQEGAKIAAAGIGAAILGIGAVGIDQFIQTDNMSAKMAAKMGVAKSEIAEQAKLAGVIYADNFGESLADVGDIMSTAAAGLNVALGEYSQEELKTLTEASITMRDLFEQDTQSTVDAVSRMVSTGMADSVTEATDMLAQGFQSGANVSDDFLDTIREYSPEFTKLGFDGADAIGLINAGLESGVRNSDYLGDMFKEFYIKVTSGDKSTQGAFKTLGMNANEAAQAIAGGGPAAEAMTRDIMAALGEIDDPMVQYQTGVALFGTKWEDAGAQSIDALNRTQADMQITADSMDSMASTANDAAQATVEGWKRSAQAWVGGMTDGTGASSVAVAAIAEFGGQAAVMGGAALQAGASLAILRSGQIAGTVATGTATVASSGFTASLWAMAAALWANPITWVIAGILALGAGLVLAYKKSETFRGAVNGAWAGIKKFGGAIKDAWAKVGGFSGVLKGALKWGAYFNPILAAIRALRALWQKFKASFSLPKLSVPKFLGGGGGGSSSGGSSGGRRASSTGGSVTYDMRGAVVASDTQLARMTARGGRALAINGA